ncbi:MAG: signal peptidase II [Acetivibrio sp.]
MIYVIIILGILIGDGFIKNYIEEKKVLGEEKSILKGKIIVTKHHNKGAMLNFMEKKPEWVKRASCVCAGGVIVFFAELFSKNKNILLKMGTSLLAGGGFSNLYDRLKKGYVVDYFIINKGRLKKVIFNLSDIMIFAGGLFIIMGSLFENKKK